ncbi:MAG: hypothetical protein E7101_05640 [Prevotella ruminicola]|jgi:hypothetical protein|uniref:Capsule polysaccharide biosynthesis protein n=1 Tax=Xylanibacter ruminicola TaxID=839 RepID=A0A9D5P402_XYLRU|nr:hypothetical protein [Xylanibacter ruminicola]
MRAVYVCCIADPYIDVAIRLKKEKGIEPIYWISDLDSTHGDVENLVKKEFPEITYQRYYDAWHGVFPREIENASHEEGIEIDFLKKFYNEELQSLSMMDRMDYDRKSFNMMERERFFLSLVRKWMAFFKLYKPDIVIASNNPHRVFDHVLYLVCKYKGIPYITSMYTQMVGRMFMLEDFRKPNIIGEIMDEAYAQNLGKEIDVTLLPRDIQDNYNRLHKDYKDAKPYYMNSFDKLNSKNKNYFFLMRRFISDHNLLIGEDKILKGQKHTIYKEGKRSPEEWNFSLWEWYSMRKGADKYKKSLFNHYNAISEEAPLDVPYVAFFLHYQPEENTCPNAGMFANQYLCILSLLRSLPDNVMIYVKEHPHQFMSHMQGQTKRIKEFYDDLAAIPRVKLINFSMDSFSLMANAMAVATVAGTAGWEAAVKGKPVIVYGMSWYERMKGVMRVTDDESAKHVYEFIQNYKFDNQAVLAYLYTFAQKSYTGYNYKGYKELTGYSHEESVENIYNALNAVIFKNSK